jgi:Family of unknown function (DUF6088)
MAKTSTKTEAIRQLIEAGGERFWHHQDLADYSSATVAKTLTQLVKEGILQRLSKGHYYHPRPTRFGPSQPVLAELPYQLAKTPLYPAGVNASNLLGFTTQNALNGTFATTAKSLPAAWLGQRAKLYTRRPDTWANLSAIEAALLDVLRSRGEWSDFSPRETCDRLLKHVQAPECFDRLAAIVHAEPPRVRAMLGAIGQEIGCSTDLLQELKKQLNPYSRFEFGKFSALLHAKEWQAK